MTDGDLVHASRTVTAVTDREEQIDEPTSAAPARAKGLTNWGNRLLLSLAIGWLAWLATGRPNFFVFAFIAAAFYAVLTAILARRQN